MRSAKYWATQEQRWYDQWVEAQKQIDELENRISLAEAALKSDPETIRLALGEISSGEMRAIQAAFGFVLARGGFNAKNVS